MRILIGTAIVFLLIVLIVLTLTKNSSISNDLNITDKVDVTQGAFKGCFGIVQKIQPPLVTAKLLTCNGTILSTYEDVIFPNQYIKKSEK